MPDGFRAMSARWRPSTSAVLALLIGLLALAGQYVSQMVTSDVLEATVRQREIDKIDVLGQVIKGQIDHHAQKAQLVARVVAANGAVAASVLLAEPQRSARLASSLDEVLRISAVKSLEITGDDEVVIYRAQDPGHSGDLAQGWGVAEALGGQGIQVSVRMPGGVSIRAIEPLFQAGRVVGTVSVGVNLDQDFIDGVAREVGAHLELLGRKGVLTTAVAKDKVPVDLTAMNEAFETKTPVYRIDTQARSTSVYLPALVIDEAYVLLARIDSSAAYELIDAGTRRATLWALATLAASVLIGLLVLRMALAPLRRLRRRAEQTALDLTGEAIQIDSSDEVTQVVKVLDTLTDRLMLRNSELAQAKVEADSANRAKSRFLSTMSHEIRTPLNGVLGMTEVLQLTRLDGEQSRFVGAIRSAGQALRDLLGDILDLAKIEEGQVVIEQVDFDPCRLLGDTVEVFREVASTRGLLLVATWADLSGQWVSGDPTRLRQVLSNLLGNAMKFTAKGEVRMAAQRLPSPADDARTWWRFSVEDTGVGIAPEAVDALFGRFVQADASTTREFGGSGLGLAICKNLVELMGGRIHLHSVPGQGSRFWFDLPLAAALGPRPAVAPAQAVPRRQGLRALVAEDNQINQEVIKSLLQHLAVDATLVDNGAAALQRVRLERFDIVFMDCQMPVMDGFEATRQIREWERVHPNGRPLPIVALTANALAGDREACLAAGMSDYLAKPVTHAGLVAALDRHVPAGASGGAQAHATDEVEASPTDFDPAILNDLSLAAGGTRPGFAERLLTLFSDGAVASLQAIETGVRDGQSETVLRELHSFKAGAAQVGAVALAAEAERQETALRAGKTPQPDDPQRLRLAIERFEAARAAHHRRRLGEPRS